VGQDLSERCEAFLDDDLLYLQHKMQSSKSQKYAVIKLKNNGEGGAELTLG
jgi:hypothetical protein